MRFVVAWILPVWASADALVRPAHAFRAMGHRKVVWLVPGPLAIVAFFLDAWFVPLAVAVLMTAVYMAKVRDLVKVAQGMDRG